MVLSDLGVVMLSIPHPQKAWVPITSSPSENSTVLRFLHSVNVATSSTLSVDGSLICYSALLVKLAPTISLFLTCSLAPSVCRPSFSWALRSCLHLQKAYGPIALTLGGKVMLSSSLP